MNPAIPAAALGELAGQAARALRDGLLSVFGTALHALYLYGSVTFADTEGSGDLDYHAILTAPPDPGWQAALAALAARLRTDHPRCAGDLDGWFISLGDARGSEPPPHLLLPGMRDASWALHRAHWLAGQCVVLHGPAPDTIVTPPTPAELRAGLAAELDFAARDDSDAYVVLNACRIAHSAATGNVVESKFGAARWGLAVLPAEPAAAITAAMNIYRRSGTAADRQAVASGRAAMLALAARQLAESVLI